MQTRILAIAAALAVGTSGACYAGAYNNDFSAGVGAASLRGTAVLDSGSVRLTPNTTSQQGSLVINDLDPGSIVQSFDASFTLSTAPAGVSLADGVSFSFGPAPGDTYGESGASSGLVVTFDLWDNGESPTPPVIRVLVNGAQVAATQVALNTGGSFLPVTVHYDSSGLDVDFNSGAVSFSNVNTAGFAPGAGLRFTFGARTGAGSAEQRIDDVSIVTSATALKTTPVPTLTQWGMIVAATLLAGLGAHALRRRRSPGIGASRRS